VLGRKRRVAIGSHREGGLRIGSAGRLVARPLPMLTARLRGPDIMVRKQDMRGKSIASSNAERVRESRRNPSSCDLVAAAVWRRASAGRYASMRSCDVTSPDVRAFQAS